MGSSLLTAFFLLAAIFGAAAVFTRNPLHQAIVMSFLGLVLGILFFLLQAPDVALSEIVVGGVIVPLMTLLTLAKVRELDEQERSPVRGARSRR